MSEFSRWIFDFETPKDWEPATPWCWINCPISIPFTEGLEGIQAADTANIIKYACRWNKKANSIEDKIENVEKIIWYATHLKEELEEMKGKETNENT